MARLDYEESRAKRRVPLQTEVSCQSRMSFGFGSTGNISETGVMINSPDTLPLSMEMEVRMVLPLRPRPIPVIAKGKVAWVRPGVAMGIEFLELQDEQRKAITEYVSAE